MTLIRPDPLDTSDIDGARPKPLPIRLRTNQRHQTNLMRQWQALRI